MLGWKEMTNEVVNAYRSLDSTAQSQTIIFCDNYGQAGAVEFYGRQKHLPSVQSKEGGYILWAPDPLHFTNLILVTDDTSDIHNPLLTNHFVQVIKVGSVTNPYARENGTQILLCRGANRTVIQFLNERQRQLKGKYLF